MKNKKLLVALIAVVAVVVVFAVLYFTLNKQEQKPTLIMATNATFPPYEYYEGEDIVGIDVEIAQAVANKMGYALKVEDMEFESIIPAVQTGKADFGFAGMTVTEDRLVLVDFSNTYATGVQVIIVKNDSPIICADDLFVEGKNYTIGVQLSTTGDLYSTWDLEDEGLANVSRFASGMDAVMALNSGKVDCVIIDNEPAKAYIKSNPGLKILDTEYVTEDYAACFKKGNTEMLEAFNDALQALIEDGTVAQIINKYIPAE